MFTSPLGERTGELERCGQAFLSKLLQKANRGCSLANQRKKDPQHQTVSTQVFPPVHPLSLPAQRHFSLPQRPVRFRPLRVRFRWKSTPGGARRSLILAARSSKIQVLRIFGGVSESMLTLFLTVSGGMDWRDALMPLRRVSPVAAVALVMYILLTVPGAATTERPVRCGTGCGTGCGSLRGRFGVRLFQSTKGRGDRRMIIS